MMRDKSAVVFPTTRAHLLAGENGGCHLCRLLIDLGVGEGPEAEVIFQVDQDPDNPVDEPVDTQYLLVHARITGCMDKFRTYCMYTPTGAFCHSLARSQIWQCTRASKIHGSAVHCRRPGGRRDRLQGPDAPGGLLSSSHAGSRAHQRLHRQPRHLLEATQECDVKLMDERLPYGRVTAGHLRVRAVVAPGWVVVEPPYVKPRSEYVDTHYYKLFGPTAELRSRLAGLSAVSAGGALCGL